MDGKVAVSGASPGESRQAGRTRLRGLGAVGLAFLLLCGGGCAAQNSDAQSSDAQNPDSKSPGPESYAEHSSPTPSPTKSASSPGVSKPVRPLPRRGPYQRVARGTPLDVELWRVPHRSYREFGPWAGPTNLDLSRLTLDNTQDSINLELRFSRMSLHNIEFRGMSPFSGEKIVVYMDSDKDPDTELEMWIFWGDPAGVLHEEQDQAFTCPTEPAADPDAKAIRVSIPRRCAGRLEQLQATATVESYCPDGNAVWRAQDSSKWTSYAEIGEEATVRDPAA